MPKQAVITEYTIVSDKLQHDMTVGLVADIHERNAADIAALLEQTRPDIIALAGDILERFDNHSPLECYKSNPHIFHRVFLTAAAHFNYIVMHKILKNLPDEQNAFAFMARAAKVAPVYYSRGNHEELFLEEDVAFFRKHGIITPDHKAVTVQVNGNTLHIGGIFSDSEEAQAWLEKFARQDGFKLLLCHRPEHYAAMVRDKDIDLTLAGHNHGGQIRLFGHGLLSSGGKLLPQYDCGVFDNRLVITAGCSNTVALPRIGNPRELVLVHLRAKPGSSGHMA